MHSRVGSVLATGERAVARRMKKCSRGTYKQLQFSSTQGYGITKPIYCFLLSFLGSNRVECLESVNQIERANQDGNRGGAHCQQN